MNNFIIQTEELLQTILTVDINVSESLPRFPLTYPSSNCISTFTSAFNIKSVHDWLEIERKLETSSIAKSSASTLESNATLYYHFKLKTVNKCI